MTFLQIMRELWIARRAGVSMQAAMLSLDDADWEVIWSRLLQCARLDRSLKKYRPRA